jgi:hypothetical protein
VAKRYQHVTSGALVSVRDEKVLGSEWKLLVEKPKTSPNAKKQS